MIELLFADCNCQLLTKKFPLRCQKFPHSSQISSQISVGFANFVDMGKSFFESTKLHKQVFVILCTYLTRDYYDGEKVVVLAIGLSPHYFSAAHVDSSCL